MYAKMCANYFTSRYVNKYYDIYNMKNYKLVIFFVGVALSYYVYKRYKDGTLITKKDEEPEDKKCGVLPDIADLRKGISLPPFISNLSQLHNLFASQLPDEEIDIVSVFDTESDVMKDDPHLFPHGDPNDFINIDDDETIPIYESKYGTEYEIESPKYQPEPIIPMSEPAIDDVIDDEPLINDVINDKINDVTNDKHVIDDKLVIDDEPVINDEPVVNDVINDEPIIGDELVIDEIEIKNEIGHEIPKSSILNKISDIVDVENIPLIKKDTTCTHILTRGKRSGMRCLRKPKKGQDTCFAH